MFAKPGWSFGLGRCVAIASLLLLGAGSRASPVLAQSVVAAATPAILDQPTPAERTSGERLRTRFVIGLERPVDFQVFALSNPNRVFVELPDVKMLLPQAPAGSLGLVKSFRGGVSAPGKSRIVIDVVAPVVVERANIEKDGRSHRLVLDIAPLDVPLAGAAKRPVKAAVATPLGVQPPLPKPAMRPQDKAAKSFRPLIVIDPGHGGHDSGATKNGIVEKDAVLAFSKALRGKLVAGGRYRVLMTRDSDVFVPLDERRAFAERNQAALFIAVHADYAGAHARGATIYSLTDSTADALRRSVKGEVSDGLSGKELAAVQGTGGDIDGVKSILADLAKREVEVNKERTNVIAKSIIEYMGASTSMRENADREANFRVLMTAQVPAVLIELAYVTNAQDAQNLKSEKWRDKVSDSIATAVDNYFANQIARLPM
jgi:N-acetylmuramoyl-L-alanine amidase